TPRSANNDLLTIGAAYRSRDSGLELTVVFDDGPAQRAGLAPGDVLVAVDRLKVTERNLKRRVSRFESGERVTATLFRGDELLEVGLVLRPAPLDTCYLRVDEGASEAAATRRKAWIGG